MFRAMFSPIIRSTWLHLQYLVVFTQVVHPAGVLEELKMDYVDCEAWRSTIHIVQFRSFNSSKTPAGSNLGEHFQILQIQSSAPDDGRKHRLKHVELTWINTLIYIVHLVGYFCCYFDTFHDSWVMCNCTNCVSFYVGTVCTFSYCCLL
jgi:hypothetical protein